jgi:pyruvoyl-dependent arginine decarboxylase (PvlArgDC)
MKSERGWRRLCRRRFNSQIGTAFQTPKTDQTGEITFCVMARAETSEPGRRIAASIGLARPKDPTVYGYISEHQGFGMTEAESGDYAEDLADHAGLNARH